MSDRTKRRSSIGENPLDALFTTAPPERRRSAEATDPGTEGKGTPRKRSGLLEPPGASSPRKVRSTYYLPENLVEEARNAVLALAGPPLHLTLAALVETAVRRELERLRKAHNKDKAFEGPGRGLRGGRPINR